MNEVSEDSVIVLGRFLGMVIVIEQHSIVSDWHAGCFDRFLFYV